MPPPNETTPAWPLLDAAGPPIYHRRMRLCSASLLSVCLLTLSTAVSPSANAQSSPQVPPPSATATYRNNDLHLTYAYPPTYVDASAVLGPALQASLGDDPALSGTAHCLSLPFSRMQAGPGPGQIAIVALARADAACLKKKYTAKSLAESTEQEAKSLSTTGAKTDFGPHTAYVVANHPADLLQGTFTLPAGQPMHALVTCLLDAPDIVCWQFLSTSPESLRSMAAFPVTFDNNAPAPLVPANLVKP